MRRLLPTGTPLSLTDPYPGVALPAERWVAIGMVSSVDGAVTIDGRSGGLGGEGDLAALRALRSLADVVLVGARTAVREHYRPTWQPRGIKDRQRRGQEALPVLALVTSSGDLPADLRTLDDETRPPLVLTTPDGAALARSRVRGRATVVEVPAALDGHVDLAAAIDALVERDLPRIAVEGGPTLNHALLTAGLADELFVTVAPTLVGGGGGIIGSVLPAGPARLVLHEVRVHGSELLCRYRIVPTDR